MKKYDRGLDILICSVMFFLLLYKRAYAYLDPGTGSYVLQLIAAFLFAGLFMMKKIWASIGKGMGGLFSKRNKRKTN